MKVTFLGAARTVTGSCYVLEAAGARFAVDCGMHQGNKAVEARNLNTDLYDPQRLDFILLTHAHIDHSGLLPRMAREGYANPVYCTPPAKELADIMLQDSAHIQETEAAWRRRRHVRRAQYDMIEPLYTVDDALKVSPLFQTREYGEIFEPRPGIRVCFRDAGHILGAASVLITVSEGGSDTRLLFSGDLGRPGALIVRDPEAPPATDYLFMESTYGDREHKGEFDTLDELAEALAYAYANREKAVIPAFAVERTQEILYSLHLLRKQGKLPADMPVFVDSPLAIRATEVFHKYSDYFDEAARAMLAAGEDPFEFANLSYTLHSGESRAINETNGPAVVISASGMCNAGRIKHHLKHNLWKSGAAVIFTGYQGVGTPGRKIVDGAKSIRLFGEDVAVKAGIFTLGGFSAHAGQGRLLEWIGQAAHPDLRIVLVHGEPQAQDVLAARILEKYNLECLTPEYLEQLEIVPGKAPAAQSPAAEIARPAVDWDFITRDTEAKWRQLHAKAAAFTARPWVEQTELSDRMLKLNFEMTRFLSEI